MARRLIYQRPWRGARPPQPEPRNVHTLPADRLHPVIRIAHRSRGPVRVGQRIIFDHELVLFLAGAGEVSVGSGAPRPFEAGHLLLFRPFVPHIIRSAPDSACEHLAVHFDLSPTVPTDRGALSEREPYKVRLARGLALPEHAALGGDDPVRRALIATVEAWAAGATLDRLAARVHLERALLALLRRDGDQRPAQASEAGSARNRTRLERAVRHIEQHYDQPLDVAQLAEVAGLSASHFNRLFRQWTSYAPAEYLRRVRVARARTLLAAPDLTVKEIAARTGFSDPYHFSKVFRQVDGLTPTAYREAALAGRAEHE
ncbi:MAG: helix-turn-helix domain-containing protein [Phycisphaeraceae bacterium]